MTSTLRSSGTAVRSGRDCVAHYASGGANSIRQRLAELDSEWTVERAVEAKGAALALAGAALVAVGGRRFALLPAIGGALLLTQAIFGGEVFASMGRPLGFRTRGEVERERAALKALRGDYRDLATGGLSGTQRYDFAYEAAGR